MSEEPRQSAPADARSGGDHHGRQTARRALQSFSASLVVIPTGLVTAAYLTRKLGPEQYGLLSVALAVAGWVGVVVVFGLDRTANRLVSSEPEWQRPATRLIQAQLATSVTAAVLLFASADAIAGLMRGPELAPLLRLVALDVPLIAMMAIHASFLSGRGRFGTRALLTSAYWLTRMILVIVALQLDTSMETAIVAMVTTTALSVVLARVFIRPPLFARPDYPWQKIWDYAWPLFFFTIAINLFGNLDLFAVQSLDPSPGAAGYFGAVKNLTVLPATAAAAVATPLLTKLSELSGTAGDDASRAIAHRAMRLALCMLPFAAMAEGAAEEIIVLIYGADFAPAAPLLGPMMLAAVGGSLIVLSTSVLISAGRPTETAAFTVPLALVAGVVYWLAIPRFGGLGAAYGTAGLSWVGAFVAVWLAHRRVPVLPLMPTLLRTLLCGIPAYWLASIWPAPGWQLIPKLLAVSAAILFCLQLSRETDRSDYEFLRSLVGSG